MMVFVDTAAWVALVAEKHPHHESVAKEWREVLERGAGLVTSSDVCSETITFLRYNMGRRIAVSFYRALQAAVAEERLLIDWVTPAIFEEAWAMFEKHDDQKFSMVDCTSFVICRKRDIETVLTLDRNFLVAGFQIVPNAAAR